MSITRADVDRIATLARMGLSDAECEQYTVQLNEILDFMRQLNELDTSNIEPLSHPLELTNVFRPDVPRPSLAQELALRNAPKEKDGLFQVPQVI